jgi:hypothetical protein
MDQDGITDIGVYVPGRTDQSPGTAQWYFLVSNDAKDAKGVNPAGAFASLSHLFSPTPLGHDVEFTFGDQQALPLVGIWDPPAVQLPSTAGWVSATYQSVLGRTPGASELAYWQNAVDNGATPQQVAQTFLDSPERLNGIIGNLYTQYLGRPADAAGLQYWSSVWVANGGSEQVQAGIIGSPEYYRTASITHPNLTPDAAWVTALYNKLHPDALEAERRVGFRYQRRVPHDINRRLVPALPWAFARPGRAAILAEPDAAGRRPGRNSGRDHRQRRVPRPLQLTAISRS